MSKLPEFWKLDIGVTPKADATGRICDLFVIPEPVRNRFAACYLEFHYF